MKVASLREMKPKLGKIVKDLPSWRFVVQRTGLAPCWFQKRRILKACCSRNEKIFENLRARATNSHAANFAVAVMASLPSPSSAQS
jgi:hypothetical protein